MSLYLKYRSQTFDNIVEQDFTKDILKAQVIRSIAGEHFNNYLFCGSRWIGKTSIARILARGLNCLNTTDGNPCNSCEHCQLIIDNRSLDIIEIDAASHTGVDNIRDEIINKAIYPPVQLRKKIYIIDEVHMLSTSAFNALLKIMEQPPSYLVFILATTELHKVPETIISRCQVFSFKRISIPGIVWRLEHICKQENFKYSTEGLTTIARLAEWGMRDAVKFLDQVSILGMIDQATVEKCLGATSDSTIKEFVDIVSSWNAEAWIKLVSSLQENNVDIYVFLKEVLHYIDVNVSSSNMNTILPVAQFVKQVYEKLKYFPHPMVLLKAELLNLEGKKEEKGIKREKKEVELSIEENKVAEKKVELEEITLRDAAKQGEVPSSSWQPSSVSSWDQSGWQWWEDYEEMKDRIVRNIGSQSVKNIWESACHVELYENNLIKVNVIEKWKLILLNMPKNKQEVEAVCSEIYNKPIQIEYQFIEKEEFLRKGLGGLLA